MRPLTPSTSLLSCLVRVNVRHFENRRYWYRVLASGFVHYHTTRTYPRQQQQHKQAAEEALITLRKRQIPLHTTFTMSNGARASSSTSPTPAKDKIPPEPRPSASIILLSRTNQVLLLRRVKTSTSFASAHVFPGGNLSEFHDGPVPPPGDAKRHVDSLAYRLGAIRETFEESGILLARKGGKDGPLLNLPTSERDEARKAIYENKVSFTAWLESVGGVPDTGKC